MCPIVQIGGRGVGGCCPQKQRLLKGVIKPEETWGDKGRYPLINSENRGDVVYEWSLTRITKQVKVPRHQTKARGNPYIRHTCESYTCCLAIFFGAYIFR